MKNDAHWPRVGLQLSRAGTPVEAGHASSQLRVCANGPDTVPGRTCLLQLGVAGKVRHVRPLLFAEDKAGR